MNDIEKAIDNLNFIKHNDFNDNIKQYKRIGVNSIDLAISALEKQIPKNVDYSELNYSRLPVSKCPTCKSTTINKILSVNHCPDCGQKIDWEVENE